MPTRPHPSPEGLAQLVTALSHGGEPVLRELFAATVSQVHALAVELTGTQAQADELVVEVYARAWVTASEYDPARAPVIQWLTAIARDAVERMYYPETAMEKKS